MWPLSQLRFYFKNRGRGTSLEAQWLGFPAVTAVTWVQSLLGEPRFCKLHEPPKKKKEKTGEGMAQLGAERGHWVSPLCSIILSSSPRRNVWKSTGVYACGIFFCSDIRGWRLKTERRKEWEEFVIRSADNGHWRWPPLLFRCQYGCSQCGVADISCRSWFQFFGGKYPEVGLPDHVEIPFEICGVSSIATVPFTFPPTVRKCSGFSTYRQHFNFLITASLKSVVIFCGFDLHYPDD